MPLPTAEHDEFRASAYRLAFVLAGLYNLAFGAWAGFFPHAFFTWFRLEAPRYPSIWACLGMVVGVYGLLYLYAARRLDRARPIIAVGLLGKVLGPAGLVAGTLTGGELPLRMLALLALNDLVWWVPFGAFLLEGWRGRRRLADSVPYLCAGLHLAAALVMLLVLRPGTEATADAAARAAFVAAHAAAWSAGFALWMAAGMSILAFYAWWAPALGSRRTALAALALAGGALACDLLGEALYIGWLPWLAGADPEGFLAVQRAGTVLTAVLANGGYTAAGILLTLGTPNLGRLPRLAAWTVWASGGGMTVAGAIGSTPGLIAASAVLFPALAVLCVSLARTRR